MADIKDRIARIKPYFRGMQVENIEGEQVIYVVVGFPYRWFIVDDLENKFEIAVNEGNNSGEWIFISEFDRGFDNLFDAIDYNIKEMEIAQERSELYEKKKLELKNLFMNEEISIDNLRTLEFTWKGKKKTSSLKPLKPTKVEDIIQEEKEEEDD